MLHSTLTPRCGLLCSALFALACASDKHNDTQANAGGWSSSNTSGNPTIGGNGAGASTAATTALSSSGGVANAQGGAVNAGGVVTSSGVGSASVSGGTASAQTTQSGAATTGGAVSAGGKQNTSSGMTGVTKGGSGGANSGAAGGGMARGGAGGVGVTGGTTAKPGGTSGIAGRTSGGTTSASSAASGGSAAATAVPSPGCGKSTPPTNGHHTISVSGTSRDYVIKVPDSYDPNHPYRLIFGWHGAKYDADWVANGEAPLTGPYFGLESEAKGSAIFVAPQASSSGWSNSDLAFADALLAEFESALCIDKSRIFSVGFSMGAIMTINLGCNRPDVFRAIAPMSGRLPSPCPSGGHIAYWASHGTDDPTIPIADGQAARDEFAKRNHCGTQTVAMSRSGCVEYQGCDQGYPVNWCTFSGVHEPAPFAGPAIWEFLSPL